MNPDAKPIEIALAIMHAQYVSTEAKAMATTAHAMLEIAEALRAFVAVVKETV